jgi:DNA-binding NarL/FixJ family response regulator
MIDVTILAMTADVIWQEFLWTESRSVRGSRLIATGSMEEACDLLGCADARLIVIDWQDSTVSSEQMDYLLWSNSIRPHPAAVLVVSESYQRDHALSLFRMGVDEYISMSEHSEQLRTIIDRMLARRRTAQPVRTVELVSQAPRPVRDPLPLPAGWIAAASTA